MTPFDQLRLCPPWLCRIMAIDKKCHHVLLDDLVKRSGIPRRTFQSICWLDEWPGLERMENFCRGCDVDPFDTERIAEFLGEHGRHLFKLAPTRMPRARLRELDRKLAKMMEGK